MFYIEIKLLDPNLKRLVHVFTDYVISIYRFILQLVILDDKKSKWINKVVTKTVKFIQF